MTPRDEEGLRLLAQGCSNKEIAGQLNLSPRTGQAALTRCFSEPELHRAGSESNEPPPFLSRSRSNHAPCDQLTHKQIQVGTLVWEGLTNRDIAKVIGTSEQVVINNSLRTTFDKREYGVAGHGGVNWVTQLGLEEKLLESQVQPASSVA